jgi:heme exporter protein B
VSTFAAVTGHTLRLALRAGGSGAVALVFFLAVIAVVPFGVGPDLNLLSRIGPALLWIAALLASLLGLDRLFGGDAEDGSLDLIVVSGEPLIFYVLGRVAGHWLVTGLPIVVAAPLLGLLLNIEPPVLATLALTLLIGTPALALIGGLGAAIGAGLPRGGLLIAVLVLPFSIPVLIFGAEAALSAAGGSEPLLPPLLLLAACTLAALALAPFAAAAALRLALE